MRPLAHFKTITRHRLVVCHYCFKAGLYWQGLTHDLSKYSPAEFWMGAKYYQGDRSPNNAEREDKGYTTAWLHHKGRNKHHLEYWIDYGLDGEHELTGMRMPVRYVVEMFCDRIAACVVYQGKDYTPASPWNYYQKGQGHYVLHPRVQKLLEKLLRMLKDKGEEATFRYIRRVVLSPRFIRAYENEKI